MDSGSINETQVLVVLPYNTPWCPIQYLNIQLTDDWNMLFIPKINRHEKLGKI